MAQSKRSILLHAVDAVEGKRIKRMQQQSGVLSTVVDVLKLKNPHTAIKCNSIAETLCDIRLYLLNYDRKRFLAYVQQVIRLALEQTGDTVQIYVQCLRGKHRSQVVCAEACADLLTQVDLSTTDILWTARSARKLY